MCFHLFSYSLILFNNVFRSFQCTSVSFLWLIPKYFIPFDVIINGIVFVFFFSDCSLSVYRNATDFCVAFYFFFLPKLL